MKALISQTILFCSCFTAIPQVLETLASIDENETTEIIVTEKNIHDLIKISRLPSQYRVTYIPEINRSVAGVNIRDILYNRLAFNKIYSDYFSHLHGRNIYFFCHQYWDFGLKLIQKLSRSNTIYFFSRFPFSKKTTGNKIASIFLRYIFGVKYLKVTRMEKSYRALITPEFIAKNRIKNYIPSPSVKKLEFLKNLIVPPGKSFKALVLLDGTLKASFINAKKYSQVYQQVVDILLSFYKPDEILVKPHPRIPENVPALLPFMKPEFSGLPAELLINRNTHLIIGGVTTTFAGSRPFGDKLLKISLIDFESLYNKAARETDMYRKYLEELNAGVKLPRNALELRQLIQEIQR